VTCYIWDDFLPEDGCCDPDVHQPGKPSLGFAKERAAGADVPASVEFVGTLRALKSSATTASQ